jgi:hypothetical protein
MWGELSRYYLNIFVYLLTDSENLDPTILQDLPEKYGYAMHHELIREIGSIVKKYKLIVENSLGLRMY